MRSSSLAALLAASLLVAIANPAWAFCQTTTCDPERSDCSPPPDQECTDIGMPLHWANRCVGFNLQQDAAPTIAFDEFAAVTHRAFQSWLAADCGDGRGPGIEVHDLGPISCDAAEYNQYAGNANIITFRTLSWPYKDATHTLALTTVTFNTENAQIYDVDIEVNAAGVQLTTTDENVQYDLEAILAHELGHYFGLAHSGDETATMYARYKRGTIDLRSLEPDDHQGICAVYPPDREGSVCDPTPRRGLKTTCGDGSPPEQGGCGLSVAGSATSGGSAAAVGLGLLSLLAALWRRRSERPAD